ncbi:MAG: hypothetical protein LRY73_19270 [Bacillus sp. (in: Bacteria)]|nr:hypothetical protein [Bacillus sp. (in: firmicutes)]
MQKWAAIASVVIAIIFVILGNSYYQNKLEDIATSAQKNHQQMVEEQQEREAEARAFKEAEKKMRIDQLTKGLSPEIGSLITNKIMDNEEIHIVAFGSRVINDSQNEGLIPWPELLELTLNDTYETKTLFHVETMSYGHLTSLQVLHEERYKEVLELEQQPDVLIIEPFIWNDNGEVNVQDTIISLELMVEFFETELENTFIFVQPAPPMYQTLFYPQYVEELKEAVEASGLTYLDHWPDWPDINDEELLTYLHEDHRMPTQEGHELWSNSHCNFSLINNLTNKGDLG